MSVIINVIDGNNATIIEEQPIEVTIQENVINRVSIQQDTPAAVTLSPSSPASVTLSQTDTSVSIQQNLPAVVEIIDSSRVVKEFYANLAEGDFLIRDGSLPRLRMVKTSKDNPTFGQTLNMIRFTTNFEDPLALSKARQIYVNFKERVEADGGIVEGSEDCVALEIEAIVAGEFLINTNEIYSEYKGVIDGSTKADLVFANNDGIAVFETMRITEDGDVIVKNPEKGIVLSSPNGTQYRIVVDDGGSLTTELY
jgi:hypothetical protein